MFTGIVTDIGRIASVEALAEGRRFRVETRYDPHTIDIGASIACSGVCLTVTRLPDEGANQRWFEVEAWEEALRLTTAGFWQAMSWGAISSPAMWTIWPRSLASRKRARRRAFA